MDTWKTLDKQITDLKKKVISLKGESVFVAEGNDKVALQLANLLKGAVHEN